jgi:hypothetical protein
MDKYMKRNYPFDFQKRIQNNDFTDFDLKMIKMLEKVHAKYDEELKNRRHVIIIDTIEPEPIILETKKVETCYCTATKMNGEVCGAKIKSNGSFCGRHMKSKAQK